MFRQLAGELPPGAVPGGVQVFRYHPAELADYLEALWARRSDRLVQYSASVAKAGPIEPDSTIPPDLPNEGQATDWPHLMYAFAIESTGIYEIFTRVLHEALHGERLGMLSRESEFWIRNFEELFFKPPPFGAAYGIESRVRPDIKATRCNAYFRMFGKELPRTEERSAEYVQPPASNRDFVALFENFLHEVWTGVINQQNIAGTNPTDDPAIADLARRLREMLRARRQIGQFGALAREEFFSVALMDWLHLTINFDSAIVEDLRAQDSSPTGRLRRVAEKVNCTSNVHADSYFQMADPIGQLLIQIEVGHLNNPANVPALYMPGMPLRTAVINVITHWSIVTGRNIKDGRVTAYPNTPIG